MKRIITLILPILGKIDPLVRSMNTYTTGFIGSNQLSCTIEFSLMHIRKSIRIGPLHQLDNTFILR